MLVHLGRDSVFPTADFIEKSCLCDWPIPSVFTVWAHGDRSSDDQRSIILYRQTVKQSGDCEFCTTYLDPSLNPLFECEIVRTVERDTFTGSVTHEVNTRTLSTLDEILDWVKALDNEDALVVVCEYALGVNQTL